MLSLCLFNVLLVKVFVIWLRHWCTCVSLPFFYLHRDYCRAQTRWRLTTYSSGTSGMTWATTLGIWLSNVGAIMTHLNCGLCGEPRYSVLCGMAWAMTMGIWLSSVGAIMTHLNCGWCGEPRYSVLCGMAWAMTLGIWLHVSSVGAIMTHLNCGWCGEPRYSVLYCMTWAITGWTTTFKPTLLSHL